jgi:predicted PhzF superfamily epimerase YddE/YHI9
LREVISRPLSSILKAAGRSFDHVVRAGVYPTRMSDFVAMNGIYAKYLSQPFPARTTIAVAALPLGACVEIDRAAWAATLSRAWSPHILFFAGSLRGGGKLYARMWAPALGVSPSSAPWHRSMILTGRPIAFQSQQGVSMGRRSEIEAEARKSGSVVTSVSVGGATTYIASGEIEVPPSALVS